MPLSPTSLADSLEQQWFARENGSLPDSAAASADRFAGCVSTWFAQAIAAGLPCVTATARRAQLMGLASTALAAQSAAGAGSQLGSAVAAYMSGQSFGPGVSAAPIATAAAISEFTAIFADLDSPPASKAQRMASSCWQLALSTLVTIPGAPPVISPIS